MIGHQVAPPRVALHGVAKTYADGTEALRGVDLVLATGMVGVLGPNGAGKTTLLSILVQELEPSAGSITFGALDAGRPRDRAHIRRRIGHLPQDFQPVALLTGREYLLHCARLRGVALAAGELRARVDALLAQVGLARDADRRAGAYSGGMKRRLGVAQALVHGPALVVVDEPTAGLDPEERIRFRGLIGEVAEGTTVVLSTHIVEDVEATCPRLVVVTGGRVRFDGAPGALMAAVDGQLWRVPAGSPLPEGAVTLSQGADGAAVHALVCSATPVRGGEPRRPRLEDAYAALLARLGGSAA